MKTNFKTITSLALFAIAATQVQAVSLKNTQLNASADKPVDWSNAANWLGGSIASTNMDSVTLYAAAQKNYYVIDGNYTVGQLLTLWQSKESYVSFSDPQYALTLDVSAQTADGTYSVLGLRTVAAHGDEVLNFSNGNINIVNTNSAINANASINVFENSGTSNNKKSLVFGENTNVNSTLNLFIYGVNNDPLHQELDKERTSVNINGTFATKTTNDTSATIYKDLTLMDGANGTNFSYSTTVNVGSTAKVTVGRTVLSARSILNIAEGASFVINTVNQSFVKDSHNLYVKSGATLNINGSLSVSSMSYLHGMTLEGTVNVGKNGSFSTMTGGYRNIQINSSGVMDISSTAKDSVAAGDGFRLNGGKMILRSENAIASQVIWIYSPKTSSIDLYSAVNIAAFSFISGGEVTITFNEGASLWLQDFNVMRGGDWGHNLDSTGKIFLVNFENYKFHTNKFNPANDLTRIFAEGFEDGSFRLEEDTLGGGYWIIGTAIVPEPATMAAILGALALSLAIYRRRK